MYILKKIVKDVLHKWIKNINNWLIKQDLFIDADGSLLTSIF